MAGINYSIEVIKDLEEKVREAALHRPMRVERYEEGTEISCDVRGVAEADLGRVHLVVERFVGGGFAGQVYRVKVVGIDSQTGSVGGLDVGKVYAMKILVPPTGFSRLFRNAIYWLGFQGPFQLQVNRSASLAGALWQKFFRRGAKIKFGDERAVVDIHVTFVDQKLGSCGELSEWVDGRTWRLEVDDRMDLLRRWVRGGIRSAEDLGSPEYRAKREFMHSFVELLHEMGGHEFARQYEWSTCKSQPNCLKRNEAGPTPSEGLVAVDFRAGLALLPLVPMSPGDFKMIAGGIRRGSLVQFDRGDIAQLERFVEAHRDAFSDMAPLLKDLKAADRTYRDSTPDITHHLFRLFYSRGLWSTIFDSAVNGWKIRNLVDGRWEKRLRDKKIWAFLFFLIGLLPLVGPFFRRLWGRPDWRRHYWGMLTSGSYLCRALKARAREKAIGLHRSGRIGGEGTLEVARQTWRLAYHVPLSVLPAGLHRFLTDVRYAKDRLEYLFVRPVRLYFDSGLREQWLRDMVAEGKEKRLLTHGDATTILSQIKEPFIQKYLKSLAVHICTLPVTQLVSVAVAIIYVLMHPELPRGQTWGIGLGIIALFQVVPISPGSLVRGFYVLYLVIRERNFKDYNIAVFLGFFKYIGYLSFPIQMGHRYPALARFMAAHWATEMVHTVPVFGERGALLEHWVFCLFYNWPLTIRRRMVKRSRVRAALKPRYWHIALCSLVGAGIFGLSNVVFLENLGGLPGLKEIWGLAVFVPLFCGVTVTLGAGGAALAKRLVGAAVCGGAVGVLSTIIAVALDKGGTVDFSEAAALGFWQIFLYTLLSMVGVILIELNLPEPEGA